MFKEIPAQGRNDVVIIAAWKQEETPRKYFAWTSFNVLDVLFVSFRRSVSWLGLFPCSSKASTETIFCAYAQPNMALAMIILWIIFIFSPL